MRGKSGGSRGWRQRPAGHGAEGRGEEGAGEDHQRGGTRGNGARRGGNAQQAGALTSRTRWAAGRDAPVTRAGTARADGARGGSWTEQRGGGRTRRTRAGRAPGDSAAATARTGARLCGAAVAVSEPLVIRGAVELVDGRGRCPAKRPATNRTARWSITRACTLRSYTQTSPPGGRRGVAQHQRRGARRRGRRGTASSAGCCQASPPRRTVRARGFWRPTILARLTPPASPSVQN